MPQIMTEGACYHSRQRKYSLVLHVASAYLKVHKYFCLADIVSVLSNMRKIFGHFFEVYMDFLQTAATWI